MTPTLKELKIWTNNALSNSWIETDEIDLLTDPPEGFSSWEDYARKLWSEMAERGMVRNRNYSTPFPAKD